MNFLDVIANPMGQILNFIYNFLAMHSYGLAIIILTLIIRLILLPLTVKQYRSMARMQEVQPQIQEIQKRYKNDKEKLNQELMKVYSDNKVNPAGGCLPLLVQMPILFSLYYVISQPLKYMVQKTPYMIALLYEKVPEAERISNMADISIINYFTKHTNELVNVANLLKKEELINLNFLGLNLGMIPTWDPGKLFSAGGQYLGLILIPILAAVTTYLSVKYSTPKTNNAGDGNQIQASMQSSMTKIMPLMTAFFAFSVPAGLGLYWIVGNLIQILQQTYMNKYVINKKKEVVNK